MADQHPSAKKRRKVGNQGAWGLGREKRSFEVRAASTTDVEFNRTNS